MTTIAVPLTTKSAPALLPLDAGEQYRFAFDMGACIGCHSCEVACAEQNGNPVSVNWRKVGEVEAGSYPNVRRFSLSMACNHCLEPTCLTGCPTNAYIKLDNGVVKHLVDSCIGCQYCVWNCPYEAPVFNPDRRIVTKCDLCLPRLEAGQPPACVAACPTGALTVEKVSVAEWRAERGTQADAPGLPPASITLSTTRIVRPADLPADALAARMWAVEPEDPHWPLVVLTLLTEVAVGTVASVAALALAGRGRLEVSAVAGAVTAVIALGAAVFHLGRPAHAWKALRNLRRSWLSREVALFGLFAMLAVAAAIGRAVGSVECVAASVGVAGVYASARLYLVPARPAWNTPRTVLSFFATVVATGPLVAFLATGGDRVLLAGAAGGTVVQLALYQFVAASVAVRRSHEWTAFGTLLFRRFRWLLALRVVLGLAGIALLVGAAAGNRPDPPAATALVLIGAGEIAGRYLFYVTVVPMTADGSFFRALR